MRSGKRIEGGGIAQRVEKWSISILLNGLREPCFLLDLSQTKSSVVAGVSAAASSFIPFPCRGGEIGRRARLRGVWEQSLGGSSPLHGTIRFRFAKPHGKPAMYRVYVLELDDGSYYVGFTDNLKRRLAEHAQGIACAHTKKIPMRRLLWSEEQPDRLSARTREKEIKGWRREKKKRLWSSLS